MKKLITLNELDQYLNQEDLAENQESAEFEEESIQENPKPLDRTNSTYNIISKVAYLIGVEKKHFENEYEPPKMEIYEELDQNVQAQIIRNLCMLRTSIELNFKNINDSIINHLTNLSSLPEYVPTECLRQLEENNIIIEKANVRPVQYIIDINRHINNRINNCKSIFPIWLNWEYVKNLFIMPSGTVEKNTKTAAEAYYSQMNKYPYHCYINWNSPEAGNILYNDKKFVELLYEENYDHFDDISKVIDASDNTKKNIHDFLNAHDNITMLVDCENSDPYRLYATLKNLDQEALQGSIKKIILFDDPHTSSTWDILTKFIKIPLEHQVIERVKNDKSLVDMKLCVATCQEYFKNDVKHFILFSSDSDYWALIFSLPEAHFLMMMEKEKCGPDIKNALQQVGVPFSYINDFCTGNSNEIKTAALLQEIKSQLEQECHFNINDILQTAYISTRAEMSDSEQRQFYNRYIKPMKLVIDDDGNASIKLG